MGGGTGETGFQVSWFLGKHESIGEEDSCFLYFRCMIINQALRKNNERKQELSRSAEFVARCDARGIDWTDEEKKFRTENPGERARFIC